MSKIDSDTRSHFKRMNIPASFKSDGVDATSMIVASDEWKILWTDGGYKELLSLPADYEAASLIDICETLLDLGWRNADVETSECDNAEASPVTPSDDKILTSFFCSPQGEVVYLSYCRDDFSGQVCIFLASGNGQNITIAEEASSTLPCLKFLNENDNKSTSPTGRAFATLPKKDYVLADAFFSMGGHLKYLDTKKYGGWFPQAIQTIGDLGYSTQSIFRAIHEQGEFKTINSALHPDADVIVTISKQATYANGPSFLRCSVQAMGARLTLERIEAYFPMFTTRETEIVLLLARGNNLKEVSRIVDRAQGTVTIQARSAMQKSQTRSLVALVSLVCQMCA